MVDTRWPVAPGRPKHLDRGPDRHGRHSMVGSAVTDPTNTPGRVGNPRLRWAASPIPRRWPVLSCCPGRPKPLDRDRHGRRSMDSGAGTDSTSTPAGSEIPAYAGRRPRRPGVGGFLVLIGATPLTGGQEPARAALLTLDRRRRRDDSKHPDPGDSRKTAAWWNRPSRANPDGRQSITGEVKGLFQ